MIKIAHLYPKAMNLYGDQGNLIVLQKRMDWLGYEVQILPIHKGDAFDPSQVDMVFMGGGSDREQGLVIGELRRFSDTLFQAVEAGLPALMICGAYQLMGKAYRTPEGDIPGLGWFNYETVGTKQRLVGNTMIECEIKGKLITVIGFENHAGRTYLKDPSLLPWGRVIKGYGNNGEDQGEGFQYRNLIATYLHGPLLPKNPAVADYFIHTILKRKNLPRPEMKLNDSLEEYAHRQIYQRLMT